MTAISQAVDSGTAMRWSDQLGADPRGAREHLLRLAARATADPHLQTTTNSPFLTRPMFLPAADRDALETDLAAVQQLLLSLPDRLFDGDVDRMCAHLGMPPSQQMAIEETWLDQRVMLSRSDLIRGREGFRAVEINVHSSLGGIDSGPWHRAMLDEPVFSLFADRERLSYVDPVDGIAGALRGAARSAGLGSFPSLAVVDWPTSYSTFAPRLTRLADQFRSRGFDAFTCHAGELSASGGRLSARGRRVDILYRTFVIDQISEDPSLLIPIFTAHRAGNVLLAMGFVAELIGNKAALAMLSDPRFGDSFDADEQHLIARVVPPTRFVRDGPTIWNGDRTSLLTMAERCREDLVLKPSGGYSARGVTPGWLTDPESWRQALGAAVDQPWVLQERVTPIPELVPQLTETGIGEQPMDVNWGVFMVGDTYNGTMIRAMPTGSNGVISTSTDAHIGGCFVEPG